MEYTLSLSFSFLSLYLPSIRVLFQLTVLQPEFPGGSLPEGSINFPSLSPDIQSVTKHYTHTYIYVMFSPIHLFYGNWIDFPNRGLLMKTTTNKKVSYKNEINQEKSILHHIFSAAFHQESVHLMSAL